MNIDNNSSSESKTSPLSQGELTSLEEQSLLPLRVVCTKLGQPYKLFYGLVHKGKYKCLRFTSNGVFYTTVAKMRAFIAEQEKYQFEASDQMNNNK